MQGELGEFRRLIAEGADVEVRGTTGWTALHFTAGSFGCGLRHEIFVGILLNAGASVSVKDNMGRTAFHVALERGWDEEEFLTMLMDAGADLAVRDAYGRTPRDCAHSEPVEPRQNCFRGPPTRTIAWKLTSSLVQLTSSLVQARALLRERWRARHVAFAMGLHPRLGAGAGCLVQALDPEVLRMVCDAVAEREGREDLWGARRRGEGEDKDDSGDSE